MHQSTLLLATLLLLLAFGLNVPLGYWRIHCAKFSLRWFLSVHLSIPFIILARPHFGFGWGVVPFTLGSAVLGQMTGGRLPLRR